jgi:hypothetical protein
MLLENKLVKRIFTSKSVGERRRRKVKVNLSSYRPGGALGVPRG